MKHCTAHACNMNGVNHLEEGDARPLMMCAECGTKLLWPTGADPEQRYARLEAFARHHDPLEDADRFARARTVVAEL